MNLITDLGYNSDGYLSSINDEGGTVRSFTYDLYGRLRQIKNHSGTAVQAYGYTYSRTGGNGWTFQPASPNAVVDTSFAQVTPSVKRVVSTDHLDGLGRPIQTVVENGTADAVAATQYDAMGRPWRAWKPYPWNTTSYEGGFSSNATSFYNSYHSTSGAKPYVETQYTTDALARPKKVIPEFIGVGQNDSYRGGGNVIVSNGNSYGEPIGVALMHELVGHGHPAGRNPSGHDINRYYQAKLGYFLKKPHGALHPGYHEGIGWKKTGLYVPER